MFINQLKVMTLIHYFLRPCVMCLKIVETDETWCNSKINFTILIFLIYIYIYICMYVCIWKYIYIYNIYVYIYMYM